VFPILQNLSGIGNGKYALHGPGRIHQSSEDVDARAVLHCLTEQLGAVEMGIEHL
jgi:hypothetical protein